CEPSLDRGPFIRADHERQHLERPRSLWPALFVVDVVGDAVVGDLARDGRGAPIKIGEPYVANSRKERVPGSTQPVRIARLTTQFVEVTGACRRSQTRGVRCGAFRFWLRACVRQSDNGSERSEFAQVERKRKLAAWLRRLCDPFAR